MISDQSKDNEDYSYNSGYGYKYEGESTEIWVADFGSHDIELSLREEIAKIKPKTPFYVSWIFTSLVIFLAVILGEYFIRILLRSLYWSEITLFWLAWLWRLAALLIWIYIGRLRWSVDWRKFFIITFMAFLLAVIIVDIFKIVAIRSAWIWLNLLVDPIWMATLIALISGLFYKFNSARGGSASGGKNLNNNK